MSERETFGQRMAKRRSELHLTQADVAAKVTIKASDGREHRLSTNAYNMYERDVICPSLHAIEKLAAALFVRPDWLAFGTES